MATWVKGRQLSSRRNCCLQYGDDRMIVVGDNLREGLSSGLNACQGHKCGLQTGGVTLSTTGCECGLRTSGVTPSTTGHEYRLQTSGLTSSTTGFANVDCGKWFNSNTTGLAEVDVKWLNSTHHYLESYEKPLRGSSSWGNSAWLDAVG